MHRESRTDRRLVLRLMTSDGATLDLPIPVTRAVAIGRSEEADLPLLDLTVSRLHARLWWHGDQLWVEDLHSRNGTAVNGHTIRVPTAVNEGDHIAIGDLTFAVRPADALMPRMQRHDSHPLREASRMVREVSRMPTEPPDPVDEALDAMAEELTIPVDTGSLRNIPTIPSMRP